MKFTFTSVFDLYDHIGNTVEELVEIEAGSEEEARGIWGSYTCARMGMLSGIQEHDLEKEYPMVKIMKGGNDGRSEESIDG